MRLYLTIFSAIFSSAIYAQVASLQPPTTNIPTSPEAGVIQRYGDVPVGYYTGMATVAIPLYTVKEGELALF